MDATEFLIAAAVVLAGGLLLPLSHGVRWTLFLLLMGLVVATAIFGGAQFFNNLYQ
jgi:hypothetical protein